MFIDRSYHFYSICNNIFELQKVKAKASDKNLTKTPKELSTQKRKKQLLSKEKKQKKLENALATKKFVMLFYVIFRLLFLGKIFLYRRNFTKIYL